uniref:Conserved oligomeric Golgi complex subunit 5 n=1 Tax=Cacopsylla melanoneura TaxID=428564 RepID=A0A8D8PPN2_9HEMI
MVTETSTNLDVWHVLEKDDFLCQFLKPQPSQGQKSFELLSQTLAVSEQLSRLSHGITLLDKELNKQVFEKHEDLVSQATWVDKLESVLALMQAHVQCLLASIERLRSKVVEPFSRIELQTLMLGRLHTTSDVLRRVARLQQLAARLSDLDSIQAATVLAELGDLSKDVDLSGLEILEEDQKKIRKETARVEKEAMSMLNEGLGKLDKNQVSTAVQIFTSLGTLDQEMVKVVNRAIKTVEDAAVAALSIDVLNQSDKPANKGGPGKATGSTYPAGNVSNFRSKLWSAWGQFLDNTVYSTCAQMALVQSVMESGDLASIFWVQVVMILTKALSKAAQGSSYIKQALEGEHPKLLRLHLDLHKRLIMINESLFTSIKECGSQFENAYLGKSLARLLDSVHSMFASGVPSSEQVDGFCRTVTSELGVSLIDEALSRAVARNIVKSVRLFCLKCEQSISFAEDATQLIETPSSSQQLNVSLANSVFLLSTNLQRVLDNTTSLDTEASSEITKSFGNADNVMKMILTPLTGAIKSAVDTILISMHQEDFASSDSGNTLYMKELTTFLQRVTVTYLAPFNNLTLVSEHCLDITFRTLDMFIRHVCMVRPLSTQGRTKLANDFKKIETAVSPLCKQLSQLGKTYRLLRSLRPLLLQSPKEITQCPLLGDVIPHSYALMILFSHAPPEIVSPHESANWSLLQLSQWLDKHSQEKDKLELISGTLQRYQTLVRDSNLPNFHEIYPLMKSLLDSALGKL